MVLSREIDRITPTFRPSDLVVGFQQWRDLLFLHWPIPPDALRPLIPRQLDIDTYDGLAYIGLVPFWMTGVRPSWAPARSAFTFCETNVRTYVHRNGEDPGVYFFSLEAASAIAVTIARLQFKLPYFWASMRMRRLGNQIEYRSRRLLGGPARTYARFEPGEFLGASAPGTLEHFLIERYYLHASDGDRLWRGQVYHTPYPVQRATVHAVRDELIGAAGMPRPLGPPLLAHYARGVDVDIFGLRPHEAL
ncbi:MAG: DUF2071 domain-containing protein [Chloroflexi bacterium]|nr:DUF2071 domain-containing protein [Chloroflexota bacterium]